MPESATDFTSTTGAPVRRVAPSRSRDAATSPAAWGSSRVRMRSAPSMMVTCEPSRANAWPSSQPMLPPPRTASRSGRTSRSHTESLVRGSATSSPGIGGITGDEPVQTIAWANSTDRPSTTALWGPVKARSPLSTCTPAASRTAGESTGSMVLIAECTCSITLAKSTETLATSIPRWAPMRVCAATEAAARRALEGTQPVQRQSPPVLSRSTRSTRAPKLAAVFALTIPAVPPPTTNRSHGPFTVRPRR